jgi:hypothetical protein
VEALRQCQTCNRYWFYRFHEYVSYVDNDDLTVWYSPLTNIEAKRILQTSDRPELGFLSGRPSFMKDSDGVTRTDGQPSSPWS